MPKFQVGQIVHLIADRRARTRDTYEVKRVLNLQGTQLRDPGGMTHSPTPDAESPPVRQA
jgi:hypothetical protein